MKKIAALLVVLLMAYLAYPYLALYRLGEALRAHDLDAVEGKVDWPAVRRGVNDDLKAKLAAKAEPRDENPLAALGAALVGKLAAPAVDAAVTPAGLVAVADADKPTVATLLTQFYVSGPGDRPLPRLIGSTFNGPDSFYATILPHGATIEDGAIQLQFELEGGYWMLKRIGLPN